MLPMDLAAYLGVVPFQGKGGGGDMITLHLLQSIMVSTAAPNLFRQVRAVLRRFGCRLC